MGRSAYVPKLVKKTATGNRRRDAELEKRARLREEIRQLSEAPLLPDSRLPPKQRERIREKVRTGLLQQSTWPGARGAKGGL